MIKRIFFYKDAFFIFILAGLSIAFSNFLAFDFYNLDRNWGADSATYWDLSTNIKNNLKFQSCIEGIECSYNLMRLPLYPLILTFFRLFNDHVSSMFIINILSLFLLSYSFNSIIRKLSNSTLFRYLAILFFLFSPIIIKSIHSYDTDLFAASLVALFTALLLKERYSVRKSFIIRTFIIIDLVMICLTRTNLFIFPLFSILYLMIYDFLHKKNFFMVVLFFVILITISSWSLRNYLHSGSFTYTTFTYQGLHLHYVYYNLDAGEELRERNDILVLAKSKNISNEEAQILSEKIYKKKLIEYLKTSNFYKNIFTGLKGVYSLLGRSYYPIYNIYFSKVYEKEFHYENTKHHQINIGNLSPSDKIKYKYFKLVFDFIDFIFVFIFCLLAIFIFIKTKFNFSCQNIFILYGSIAFIAITGLTHGLMISDRGLLPVYFTFLAMPLLLNKNKISFK